MAELSFGELWVPSQGHAHPFYSFLCISSVLFPNISWFYHFPLTFTHTHLSSTPSSLMPNPPASGPPGQLFPWSFPETGPLPPPHQVPSPRHSSYSCLTTTLIFFTACITNKNAYLFVSPRQERSPRARTLPFFLLCIPSICMEAQAWEMIPCCPYECRCHSCASERQDRSASHLQ